MNVNIIAVILSYFKLNEVSDILEVTKPNENIKETIILNLAYINKTCFYNINAKINNYQFRCGKCNINLFNDFSIKQGITDCSKCKEKKGINIELCNLCSGLNIKRGEFKRVVCSNHIITYIGVNLLSY